MTGLTLHPRARGGFTLAEVLIAMVLVTTLAATVVPALLNHLRRGIAVRVSEDLANVANAAETARMEVGVWPASLAHLVMRPVSGDSAFPRRWTPNTVGRWGGPYLEKPGYQPTTGLVSGGTAVIHDSLRTDSAGYVVAVVNGLSRVEMDAVDRLIDSQPDSIAGLVTYNGAALQYRVAELR